MDQEAPDAPRRVPTRILRTTALALVPVVLYLGSTWTTGIDRDSVGGGPGSFTMWHRAVPLSMYFSSLVSALVLVALGGRVPAIRFVGRPIAIGAVALIYLFGFCYLSFVAQYRGRAPAGEHAFHRTSDGVRYAVISWGFMQGSALSLVRIEGDAHLRQRGLILASSYTDEDTATVVIRPSRCDPDAALVEGEDGVIAMVWGMTCGAAWSPRTGEVWTGSPSRPEEPGGAGGSVLVVRVERSLREMSPFLLLGDSGEGRAEDLDQIVAEVEREARRLAAEGSGRDPLGDVWRSPDSRLPMRASVETALASKNPWVRAAAQRILDAASAGPQAGGERR